MKESNIIKFDKEFEKGCTRRLIFFANINLKNSSPNVATTYQDLKDKVANIKQVEVDTRKELDESQILSYWQMT